MHATCSMHFGHCDLFMRRVEENGDCSLFCPPEAHGLTGLLVRNLTTLYERYEKEGRARKTIKAQEWRFRDTGFAQIKKLVLPLSVV